MSVVGPIAKSLFAYLDMQAQGAGRMSAQGKALGLESSIERSPKRGGPNLLIGAIVAPLFSDAHFGASQMTDLLPSALPRADLELTRWAGR